jgi:hypothetical protein
MQKPHSGGNPLHQRGEPITNKAFTFALEKCVKGMACFN